MKNEQYKIQPQTEGLIDPETGACVRCGVYCCPVCLSNMLKEYFRTTAPEPQDFNLLDEHLPDSDTPDLVVDVKIHTEHGHWVARINTDGVESVCVATSLTALISEVQKAIPRQLRGLLDS